MTRVLWGISCVFNETGAGCIIPNISSHLAFMWLEKYKLLFGPMVRASDLEVSKGGKLWGWWSVFDAVRYMCKVWGKELARERKYRPSQVAFVLTQSR
jgi:hypothetical protein